MKICYKINQLFQHGLHVFLSIYVSVSAADDFSPQMKQLPVFLSIGVYVFSFIFSLSTPFL